MNITSMLKDHLNQKDINWTPTLIRQVFNLPYISDVKAEQICLIIQELIKEGIYKKSICMVNNKTSILFFSCREYAEEFVKNSSPTLGLEISNIHFVK